MLNIKSLNELKARKFFKVKKKSKYKETLEKIVSAAVKFQYYTNEELVDRINKCNPYQYMIICGKNHGDCFNKMKQLIGNPNSENLKKPVETGFYTSLNRYVDRKEALKIAAIANQIIHKHNPQDELCSEDLYLE